MAAWPPVLQSFRFMSSSREGVDHGHGNVSESKTTTSLTPPRHHSAAALTVMRGAVPSDRLAAGSFSLSAPRNIGSERSLGGSARFVVDSTEDDATSLLPDKLAASTSAGAWPACTAGHTVA